MGETILTDLSVLQADDLCFISIWRWTGICCKWKKNCNTHWFTHQDSLNICPYWFRLLWQCHSQLLLFSQKLMLCKSYKFLNKTLKQTHTIRGAGLRKQIYTKEIWPHTHLDFIWPTFRHQAGGVNTHKRVCGHISFIHANLSQCEIRKSFNIQNLKIVVWGCQNFMIKHNTDNVTSITGWLLNY